MISYFNEMYQNGAVRPPYARLEDWTKAMPAVPSKSPMRLHHARRSCILGSSSLQKHFIMVAQFQSGDVRARSGCAHGGHLFARGQEDHRLAGEGRMTPTEPGQQGPQHPTSMDGFQHHGTFRLPMVSPMAV